MKEKWKFQFKAKDNARYRIEKFLLLDDIPESPVRERKLKIFATSSGSSEYNHNVVVNFTTSEPSLIEIDSEFEYQITEKIKKRNHQILFFHIEFEKSFSSKSKLKVCLEQAFSLQTYKVQINYSSSRDLRIPIHRCSTSELIDNNLWWAYLFRRTILDW